MKQMKMIYAFLSGLLLFLAGPLSAQLIVADPPFPSPNDEVTITFDATQGTGGLANCNCDVYLHTGVITAASTSPSDWKHVQTEWGEANPDWQLTPVPGESNKYTYTIGPSIRDYYGVPEAEDILRMAFVFRNADGSIEGKASGNADIFYDVYSEVIPLTINLTNPLEDEIDLALGQSINVSANASVAATIRILEDGMLLTEVSNATEINYSLQATMPGEHAVEIIATDGNETVSESFTYTATYRVDLTAPSNPVVLTTVGANIPIMADAYITSDLEVFVDGVSVASENGATSISTTVNVMEDGVHDVMVTGAYQAERDTARFVYVVPGTVEQADPPGDHPHGITDLGGGSVLLQLFAPAKEVIFVLGDFNNWQPSTDYQMKQDLTGDLWWLQLDGLVEGESYAFQYLVDGEIYVADPYSTVVLDPWNDSFIPSTTYPDLPAYPEGRAEGMVSLIQPGAPAYDWQVDDFSPPAKEELVVYELLLRDFIAAHDYTTLIDTLSYLERLGINAIELMPINEFEGNISWGYNPSFHMALDKYYGPINEMKRFVDECHARGIAVIVDVVYNHAFSLSPLCRLYWDEQAFKPTPDNPWVNPDPKHDFNVGYDLNHESPATTYFIDRVMSYWIEEFRVDGFRFDLSKGFTQNANGPFDAGPYDASRIAIIKHYADVIWALNPDFYVILEHFTANTEETELTTYGNGMMVWGGFGPHDEYLEGAMGYFSDFNNSSYTSRGWTEPNLIPYIESHDEERLIYKTSNFGNASGDYDIQELLTGLRRSELTHVFFLSIPGPKMLWQFQELGYGFSINYCADGSINDGCRTDPKPIRWDYQDSPNRQRLFDVVAAMIHLKTEYEVFNTSDFNLSLSAYNKRVHLNGDEMDVAVIGNFNVTPTALGSPFQHDGWWYEYFSGDSLFVENPNAALDLLPGEYRLYTTVRLDEPPGGFISSTRELVTDAFSLQIMPNPASDWLVVDYQLPQVAQVQIQLLDLLGRPVQSLFSGRQGAGAQRLSVSLDDLPGGMYLLQLRADGQVQTEKILIR
jgi:glycosidase